MINKLFKYKKSELGFTLLEIIIVISIIVILIVIIMVNVRPTTDKTIGLQIKEEAQDVYDIAEVYRLSTSVVNEMELRDKLNMVLNNRYSTNSSDPKHYKITRRTEAVTNRFIYKVTLEAKIDENLKITSEFEVIENNDLLITCIGDSSRAKDLVNSGVCDI